MAHNSGKTYAVEIPENASAEALEMLPILTELVNDIGHNPNENLSNIAAWKTIRKQNGPYQSRLALAVAETKKYNSGRVGSVLTDVLAGLVHGTLILNEADILRLFTLYHLDFEAEAEAHTWNLIYSWPVRDTLGQAEKLVKKNGLGPDLQNYLNRFLKAAKQEQSSHTVDGVAKLQIKVQEILALGGDTALPIVEFATGDGFGRYLGQFAQDLDPTNPLTKPWFRLLQVWQKASGAQPTAKYRKELDVAMAAVGPDAVREQGRHLLAALAAVRPQELTHTNAYNGRSYTYTNTSYLLEPNVNIARGIIWTMQPLLDDALMTQLADYAVRCYQKIPGQGPMAAGLGNACLLALAGYGLPGVAALARVRPKIKQTNTQELIGRHIEKASQELGVSPAEIEDMAVPTFGVENGQSVETLAEYTATLTLHNGKAEITWQKAGKPLKSAPRPSKPPTRPNSKT